VNAKGVFLKGLERSEDLYASIDLAVDKIEKQLIKYKEKLKSKKLMDKEYDIPLKLNVYESTSLERDNPQVVVSKNIPVKPMDVDEAVMQMELLK